jgi:TM2 domain-containing membrane protein YozV
LIDRRAGIEAPLLHSRRKTTCRAGGTAEAFRMGQGSTGNVIAALCSFFIPGLGQLIQGRLLMAIIQFVLAGLLWIVLLGWLVHLWSILDAAMFKPRG